ncbi:MAG: GNAT family protein [Bacteroidales bacterium]|jgi:RimJ/RimL family protein N-acetyltransferase
MNLSSERLTLKEIDKEDIETLHRLNSMPEIDEFNTLGIPENIDKTIKTYQSVFDDQKSEKRKLFCWIVWKSKSDEIIGLAGMKISGDRFNMGEIYYNLDPEFWGWGFATEVARTLIKFGFEELRLHRIEAGVATENKRSVRVLEKAGMTREGVRRKILPIRGEWKDNFHYAILEDDERDY